MFILLSLLIQCKKDDKTTPDKQIMAVQSNEIINQDKPIYNISKELLSLFDTTNFDNHFKIDTLNGIDSTVYCFLCCGDIINDFIIRIIYEDSGEINNNIFDSLRSYFNKNNWEEITYCMADGPDGTSEGHYNNNSLIYLNAEWDGHDDSDTTLIPSEYFKLEINIMETDYIDSLLKKIKE
jgi:hypothetical protein